MIGMAADSSSGPSVMISKSRPRLMCLIGWSSKNVGRPDVTGDALARARRFARPLEALDGDRPRRIGDEGAPDDLQLAATPVERLAGDGVGVLVRAVGHRDCAGAGRGAGRFHRSTLELGGWSL